MSDRKSELNSQFSLSSKLSDEQNRQINIDKLKEERERDLLKQMCEMRDTKLKIEQERAKREEDAIIKHEMEKRDRAKQELHLTMKTVHRMSREQLEKQVRSDVRNSHGAELDRHRDELEKMLNREIDKELKAAQSRQNEKERSQEHAPNNLKRPWEANAHKQESSRPWDRRPSGRERER